MLKCLIALGAVLVAQAVASAAIIYEPSQYQYRGANGQTVYYGGRHLDVVADAERRTQALRFLDPNYQPHNFIIRTDQTPAVYSDVAPYMNLSVYGYTALDAANEANANIPRYFRMRDLLPAGHPDSSGNWVVPANAKPVERVIKAGPTTRPTSGVILIIPKANLPRPDNRVGTTPAASKA